MIISSLIIAKKTLLSHPCSSSNDMDVDEVSQFFEDIEDQNLTFYDRQEKNDKLNFIDMYKDKHSYPKLLMKNFLIKSTFAGMSAIFFRMLYILLYYTIIKLFYCFFINYSISSSKFFKMS